MVLNMMNLLARWQKKWKRYGMMLIAVLTGSFTLADGLKPRFGISTLISFDKSTCLVVVVLLWERDPIKKIPPRPASTQISQGESSSCNPDVSQEMIIQKVDRGAN